MGTRFGTDDSNLDTQFAQNKSLSVHRLGNFDFRDFYASCDTPEKSGTVQIWIFWIQEEEFGVHELQNELQNEILEFMNSKIVPCMMLRNFNLPHFPNWKSTIWLEFKNVDKIVSEFDRGVGFEFGYLLVALSEL